MNNLPLKPLVWKDLSHGDVCVVRVDTPMYDYAVVDDSKAFKVGYYNLQSPIKYATGFATIDEAKQWAWNHYNEKMQPDVKPTPTWIDVSDRLPEDKEKYLVLTECGKVWTGHYGLVSKNPNEWYLHGYTVKQGWHPYEVTHWMPIPEFSTMQNLHKGE